MWTSWILRGVGCFSLQSHVISCSVFSRHWISNRISISAAMNGWHRPLLYFMGWGGGGEGQNLTGNLSGLKQWNEICPFVMISSWVNHTFVCKGCWPKNGTAALEMQDGGSLTRWRWNEMHCLAAPSATIAQVWDCSVIGGEGSDAEAAPG